MLNKIEKEITILKAVQELIDSIVNHDFLEFLGDVDATEIRFSTTTHGTLFNILLVDLLSKIDKRGVVEPDTYLKALRKITSQPNFDVDHSVDFLRDSTQKFTDWLNTSVTINQWLSLVSVDSKLEITRFELVKISGDICRHNVLRSVGVAERLKTLLANSGIDVSLDQVLLMLPDLNERWHDNIFYYHSSTITEFLNNMRWGIHIYLRPEFEKSIVYDSEDHREYRYVYPNGVNNDFSRHCYWELMNAVRDTPCVERFQVPEWIKMRY